MTVDTFCAKRAYQLSDDFVKRGIKVVLGNNNLSNDSFSKTFFKLRVLP